MNIDSILYGLIAFLIGLMAFISDKPRTVKDKRTRKLGTTEGMFKSGYWGLMIGGIISIIMGLNG